MKNDLLKTVMMFLQALIIIFHTELSNGACSRFVENSFIKITLLHFLCLRESKKVGASTVWIIIILVVLRFFARSYVFR